MSVKKSFVLREESSQDQSATPILVNNLIQLRWRLVLTGEKLRIIYFQWLNITKKLLGSIDNAIKTKRNKKVINFLFPKKHFYIRMF